MANLGIEAEVHTKTPQVEIDWKKYSLMMIVSCKFEAAQVGRSLKVTEVLLETASEFHCTVPGLEAKSETNQYHVRQIGVDAIVYTSVNLLSRPNSPEWAPEEAGR